MITLSIRKLTTGVPELMVSLGNIIADFNKQIWSVGTDIFAHEQDPGNLFPQLFATYADCSSDNGPFTKYIEILDNQYNNGTHKLESKDINQKAKVEYNKLKDKVKFEGNSKVKDPVLTLKAEIEKLNPAVTKNE